MKAARCPDCDQLHQVKRHVIPDLPDQLAWACVCPITRELHTFTPAQVVRVK